MTEPLSTHAPPPAEGGAVAGLQSDSTFLVSACGLQPDDPIIDVGGASSSPVAAWVSAGYRDISVLDEDLEALEALHKRLGEKAQSVTFLQMPVLQFRPHRRYALWHDRGVFHRLVHPDDRQAYVEIVQQALRPEGSLVITTFGPEGPDRYDGAPVVRYSARTLPAELGSQFELAEHSLAVHRLGSSGGQQLLRCRFRRHAPQWPSAAAAVGADDPAPSRRPS